MAALDNIPNPLSGLLDWLFGKVAGEAGADGSSAANAADSAPDAESGLTVAQMATLARQADAVFASILTAASTAAGTATAPEGTPFVATAAALVGAAWQKKTDKEKAMIVTGQVKS